MRIQDMFVQNIDRSINGVVKVAQNDTQSLEQELREYIITKELRKHFYTFFENYSKAILTPNDQIGVWISGFFGSGKSHFLKMLSYLLSNQKVAGRHAFDYFADKFDDPVLLATVQRCVQIPTEAILFNIDIEGPINKDKTAVFRVFAKVFYNHCGFYGEDLKIAKLEQFIDRQGKTAEFRKIFRQINGAEWLESRDSAAFFEDDIVETLESVLGMSETAARNWFNSEENGDMSIHQLVSEIKEYADSKGKNFRLLFMVDEVGQYIGDDGDLMMNLQSLVEEIGDKCRGKVWVMVTSQEAIDSVVKITGNDFSKIQGRFNTRLSLSSSSVDEVIKKRVLEKKPEAAHLLEMEYEKQSSVLRNLFTFNNPILDIKGYTSAKEYTETFPFVPYQFIVIQKVLAEIRKHGNSGKHLSGGERSMLSGFQEAAQKVENRDENALVPFYQFYDTVHTFLESAIRRVIDRAQNAADHHDGLEQQDVSVLKLLYLIRYIEDVKANIDNIAILMIDDIRTDKIALRNSIKASLERLLTQNYISRNGDTYAFLTDEEQEIAIDIKNTPVDSAQIVQSISQTIFNEIYAMKKFRYGKYDFSFDRYVDETLSGTATGGMRLRILTVASDYYGSGDQRLIMDSQVNNEAIVVLSNETPYFDELEQAMKIRKFVKQRNVSQMPESIQRIIRERNEEARKLELRAKDYMEQSIVSGKFYVHGEILELKGGSAKDRLDAAMQSLVESVYSKLNLVNQFVSSDADILAILNGAYEEIGFTGMGANNEDALSEISQWLELQNQKLLKTSMGDVQRRYQAIPYGWKEIDIAAMMARLIVQQKIQIQYGGAVVNRDERRLVDFLRKKSEIDKAIVVRRIAPSEDLMRKSIRFLREYLGAMDIPSDEDGLIRFVLSTFEGKREHYRSMLSQYEGHRYPQKSVVTDALQLMEDVLSQKKDNVALLSGMVKRQDDLLDSAEDMESLELFFQTQRTVFDDAQSTLDTLQKERDYLDAQPGALELMKSITAILIMPKPYGSIDQLPGLRSQLMDSYDHLLSAKRDEVASEVQAVMGEIHTLSATIPNSEPLVTSADCYLTEKREAAQSTQSLTELDAAIMQLSRYRDTACQKLETLRPRPESPEPEQAIRLAQLRRTSLLSPRRLMSQAEVDQYIEQLRRKLYDALEDADGIQIS